MNQQQQYPILNAQDRNQQQRWTNNDPYVQPNLSKCFYCHQPSHLSNNGLNQQAVTFVKEGGGTEEQANE